MSARKFSTIQWRRSNIPLTLEKDSHKLDKLNKYLVCLTKTEISCRVLEPNSALLGGSPLV